MLTANDLPKCLKGSRCIVHIDLDCFYCQVEEVRLGLPRDKPAAVQQWQGLIAVNYAARRAGITRHCNVQEAKEKCPEEDVSIEINLVHVATFAENDPEPRYYPNPSRATHKVSLDPYRQASKKIFKIFAKYCSIVQKIGLDEAFLDMTSVVNEEIVKKYLNNNNPDILDKLEETTCDIPIDWDSLGVTIESQEEKERSKSTDSQDSSAGSRWTPTTWQDLQLAIGAEIAKRIRKEIYDELQYTCSAGIGHNKVVAKLCSNCNKPNNQTILRNVATLTFMHDIPFRKIRNLGGKLGSEVEDELSIQKSGDIWHYSLESLQKKFGDSTGLWIYNIARGIDGEEVTVTKAPKSLMAAKSMSPHVRSAKEMQRWATILSNELHMRLSLNFDDFGTWPRTLCIHLRSAHDTAYRSKSCNMLSRGELRSPDKLAQKVLDLLSEIGDPYPCVGLSLQATGMVEDESAKTHNISKFFAPKQPDRRDQGQQQQQQQQQQQKSPSPNTSKPVQAVPKKTGLLAFYLKSTDMEKNMQESLDLWTCDKCLKKFPYSKKDEHSDYHFALELQQQERSGLSSFSNTSSTNSSSPKKRKADESLPDSKKPKKNIFFAPRS